MFIYPFLWKWTLWYDKIILSIWLMKWDANDRTCTLDCVYKEKLQQAFSKHIGWMENYFRNLTAKVCASLDNPIKSYDFSKFWLISCMLPSQVALCYNLWCHNSTTVSNETVHKFHKMLLFMKTLSSLYFHTLVHVHVRATLRLIGHIVKAPVFGTLNSAISNFQTWFFRTVMEVLKYCWM